MAAIAFRSSGTCRLATSRTFRTTRPRAVVVRASQAEVCATRRQFAAAGAAALVAFVQAAPAQAFLGFGDDKAAEEAYSNETSAILELATNAVNMPKDDPDRDAKIVGIRKEINGWVAKYRRDTKFSGRPSFGNTYSALNALAGHYNSFGTQASIPKKRLDRLQKELSDAQLLLARGR